MSSTNIAIFTTSEAGLSHPVSKCVFRVKVHLEELTLVDQTKISSSKNETQCGKRMGKQDVQKHLSFSCFLSFFLLSHFGLFWHFVKLLHRDTSATISVERGFTEFMWFFNRTNEDKLQSYHFPAIAQKSKSQHSIRKSSQSSPEDVYSGQSVDLLVSFFFLHDLKKTQGSCFFQAF